MLKQTTKQTTIDSVALGDADLDGVSGGCYPLPKPRKPPIIPIRLPLPRLPHGPGPVIIF